jgi:hypothetical protein
MATNPARGGRLERILQLATLDRVLKPERIIAYK